MSAVEPLFDIMNYYHLCFIMIYCGALGTIFCAFAGLRDRKYLPTALVITTLTGIGTAAQLLFTGVLADNQVPNTMVWSAQAFVVLLVCVILWFIEVVLIFRKRK